MFDGSGLEQLNAQKRRFAAALLKFGDPLQAATEVCSSDLQPNPARLHQIADNWPGDEYVKAVIEEIQDGVDNEMALLPTKADVARRLWAIGTGPYDGKTRVAALKTYADVCGFSKPEVVKPEGPGQSVMVVKDHGSDEEWEAKVAAQQERLMRAN